MRACLFIFAGDTADEKVSPSEEALARWYFDGREPRVDSADLCGNVDLPLVFVGADTFLHFHLQLHMLWLLLFALLTEKHHPQGLPAALNAVPV